MKVSVKRPRKNQGQAWEVITDKHPTQVYSSHRGKLEKTKVSGVIDSEKTKVSGVIDSGNDACYTVLMPRPKRADEANCIYHALNRGNAKNPIFKKEADFDAFERILAEGLERYSCQILAYQLLSHHWHFVLRPLENGAMSNFLRRVTWTHTQRYHAH